ncbi:MAG: DUF5615 family PIN-like protein [Bacteroidia bacterium]
MKLLFDQNISYRVIGQISEIILDAKHVKDFNLQFATDHQIWNFAKENEFHIVTFDADFYDLVTLYGHPPKIIWLRLGNTSTQNLARIISNHLEDINSFISEDYNKELACFEIDR